MSRRDDATTKQTPRWIRAFGPLLLRLLPKEFRRRYGEDLLLALDDLRRDSRRRESPGRGWLPFPILALATLVKTGVAERAQPTVPAALGRRTTRHPGQRTHAMDIFLQDLKFAWRRLFKRPAFAALAVLTLAVGVGANAAVFGVFDAVVLQPLPYPAAESLIQLRTSRTQDPAKLKSVSQPDIEDVARDARSLHSLVGFQTTSVTFLGESGSPEVIPTGSLTSGLLDVFGLAPVQGRDLASTDNVPNGRRVVVVSEDFVSSRMESGAAVDGPVVGEILRLDGEAYEIVGVAPSGFDFPREALLWKPLYSDVEGCGRGCNLLTGVGRLAQGSSLETLARELEVIGARLEKAYPEDNLGKGFVARDLQKSLLGGADEGLKLLLGSVFLVLLIAASNLAGLQIARTHARRSELAVRSALGASRSRICSMLLWETLLLGLGGGALGYLLGLSATQVVLVTAPSSLPRVDGIGLDPRVFGFSLAAALLSSLLLAVWPAWRLAARSVGSARRTTGDRDQARTRNWLMVGEVALCFGLLVGAGLLLRTYSGLLRADLGFDPTDVSSFFVALPEEAYDAPEKVVSVTQRLEAELRTIPGVVSVGSGLGRPFSGNSIGTSFVLLDEPDPAPGAAPGTRIRIVSEDYLKTLRVPIVSGRDLAAQDRQGVQPVVLVNEEWVRRYSSGEDPVGRVIQLDVDFGFEEKPRTIVGVAGDTLTQSITDGPEPEVFIPQAQMASPWMSVVLRTERETPWREMAAAVARVDPHLPLRSKETLLAAIAEARGPARFYLILMSAFSAIAAFLAAIGLYGVVSQAVTQRRREIAIRLALGAGAARVVRQILSEGLRTVGVGIGAGLVLTALGTRLLDSLLFQVDALDPAVLVMGILGMLTVALLALLVPALRAGRVPAASALQED